jgi:hypothetical protein
MEHLSLHDQNWWYTGLLYIYLLYIYVGSLGCQMLVYNVGKVHGNVKSLIVQTPPTKYAPPLNSIWLGPYRQRSGE